MARAWVCRGGYRMIHRSIGRCNDPPPAAVSVGARARWPTAVSAAADDPPQRQPRRGLCDGHSDGDDVGESWHDNIRG